MVTLTCQQCGSAYEAKPYIARRPGGHFCGQVCYGLWQKANPRDRPSRKVPTACSHCANPLLRYPYQLKARSFCGHACRHQFMVGHMRGAANPSWRGGHTCYRGPNWTTQKRIVLRRDNHTCQSCGSRRRIQVHHRRPFNLFDSYLEANQIDNLVTLCPVCHGKAEAKFWKDNPHLADQCRVPFCLHDIPCRKCGEMFRPRSGKARTCDACCHVVCLTCGKQFYSRKAAFRNVSFCSSKCFGAAATGQPRAAAKALPSAVPASGPPAAS